MFSIFHSDVGAPPTSSRPRPFPDFKVVARWREAADRVEAALDRLRLLEKANFDPDQPRDERGRWSGAGHLARAGRIVARVGRGTLRASLAVARIHPVVRPIGFLADVAAEHMPYFDEPKSLDELQRLAATPARGYDVHHIVEQAAGRRLGMSAAEIDDPGNLVRIPTFKHWELNSWYETSLRLCDNLSPRKYLLGKDATEHRRLGLIGLKTIGVLAP